MIAVWICGKRNVGPFGIYRSPPTGLPHMPACPNFSSPSYPCLVELRWSAKELDRHLHRHSRSAWPMLQEPWSQLHLAAAWAHQARGCIGFGCFCCRLTEACGHAKWIASEESSWDSSGVLLYLAEVPKLEYSLLELRLQARLRSSCSMMSYLYFVLEERWAELKRCDLHVTSSRFSVSRIIKRIKAITTALEYQNVSNASLTRFTWSGKIVKNTHKPPRRNIIITLNFLLVDIWSRSTPDIGNARITASRATLKVCTTCIVMRGLMQCPGISISQAFRTGVHWNAKTRLSARNHIRTKTPTILIHFLNWPIEKILL